MEIVQNQENNTASNYSCREQYQNIKHTVIFDVMSRSPRYHKSRLLTTIKRHQILQKEKLRIAYKEKTQTLQKLLWQIVKSSPRKNRRHSYNSMEFMKGGALPPASIGGGALYPPFPITCRFCLFLQLEINKYCIFAKRPPPISKKSGCNHKGSKFQGVAPQYFVFFHYWGGGAPW